MFPRFHIGILLVITGIFLVIAGLVVLYGHKIPLFGHLPGDINFYGKGWSFHFPIITALIISLLLTIILNLFFRR